MKHSIASVVKKKLLDSLSLLEEHKCEYTAKASDFSRNRRISFQDAILSTIALDKTSCKNEILRYFDFEKNTPTASALLQQRKKIKHTAFQDLFYSFLDKAPHLEDKDGFDVIAIDGSSLQISRNPEDTDTYKITDSYGKGYNSLHIHAAYDVYAGMYRDILIESGSHFNEQRAMCHMIDNFCSSNGDRKFLFLADRGYDSLHVMAHAIENHAFVVIRAREKHAEDFLGQDVLGRLDNKESFDCDFTRLLTRSRTQEVASHPERYICLYDRPFDYIPKDSRDPYEMHFRIVRFKLSGDSTETLITNLPKDEYPVEVLKELYKKRWTVETSFRDLKFSVGLTAIHSRLKELVFQEIYARAIMYNICSMIANGVEIKNKEKEYRISLSKTVFIVREFLTKIRAKKAIDVESLIIRELIPVRKGRNSPRYVRARTAVSFLYR